MVGSSKILTVSYGTFSCTLEGFDDSFDTMKAIAEYFRDLAADDRYFGAEPPTPDAEMLARIAEKEIARRVEARLGTSGIVLRPAVPDVVQPDPAPAPQVARTPAPAKHPAESPLVKSAAAQAARAAARIDDIALADERPALRSASVESVSDKLQRIRAVVGRNAAKDPDYIEDISEPTVDPLLDLDLLPDTEQPIPLEDLDLDIELPEPDTDGFTDDQSVDDLPDTDQAGDDRTEPQEPAPATAEAPQVPVQSAPEPLRPRVIRMKREDFERAFAQPLPEAVPAAPGPDNSLSAARPETADLPDRATLDGLDDFDLDIATHENAFDTDADADLLRELANLDDLDDLLDDTGDSVENAFLEEDEIEDEDDLGDDLSDTEEYLEDLDDEDDTPQPASALRRGRDLLPAGPDQQEADISRLLLLTDEHLQSPESDQRRQTLSHLKAAVAATEAARRMGEEPDADDSDDEDAFRKDLSEAVRPTVAQPGDSVRPRRAELSGAARAERPYPAPLKLVASQRIDLPAGTVEPRRPVMPVRPRRVGTDAAAALADSPLAMTPQTNAAPAVTEVAAARPVSQPDVASFSDFAAGHGATSLLDLIEAAAAHTVQIDGLEDFSRPQIMKKVQSHFEDRPFSREDGLRAFGTLLRQNRLYKVRNGRFGITDKTGYQA